MRHNVRVAKNKQDKRQVKPRKEIQKRSFWRRFFSSFLSLLKEKRPPEAIKITPLRQKTNPSETKERGDPRRGAEYPLAAAGKSIPWETKREY